MSGIRIDSFDNKHVPVLKRWTEKLEDRVRQLERGTTTVVVRRGGVVAGGTTPTPPELPAQTGHNGEFLTTDGTTPGWAPITVEPPPLELPTQTGHDGEFLTTDGATPTWSPLPQGFQNPMTTPGDMIVGGAAGVPEREAAGTNGYVWSANGPGVKPSWKPTSAVLPDYITDPDTPPAVADPMDQEGSAALNPNWVWFNQSTATLETSKGMYTLTVPATTSGAFRGVLQNAPATPWEVTLKCAVASDVYANQVFGGIILHDTVANKQWLFTQGYYSNVTGYQNLSIYQYQNFDGWNLTPVQQAMRWGPIWLRVRDDGIKVIFSFSVTGKSYTKLYEVTRTTWTTNGPNRVGIALGTSNNGQSYLDVYHFRRTF